MRVFFDASVIITALLSPHGGSSFLIEHVKQGRIIGVTSQTVIDEITDPDKSQKLQKSKAEIEIFIANSKLLVRARLSQADIESYKDKIDVEDAHLIAGASFTKCNYLVSLDKKHVVREDVKKQFLPLVIVSPKELLEKLVAEMKL
ncbi:TPA: putative toxin-antitoxin system toxin component, PIN family [Patescibacteria group bacterium]|uniref:PIN domain-containing protein n=1 Tax=Candidatus Gottesmanbacteria bacterium GW2011_GWA1_43_11 TaxID=1618436 RepID=A0A0G1CJG7_9BACT|nr:MAG: hypothetical protein UV59_C0006G0073 [Candidatus Gottesmanbacteria bacterium GW2011_GWA1_43_11]HCS79197.1 putative toxin-antitoxin system toxin component, PIN family [Patescibacteria group bacterium]